MCISTHSAGMKYSNHNYPEFNHGYFLDSLMPSPATPLPKGEGRKSEKIEWGRRFTPTPFYFFRGIMRSEVSHVSESFAEFKPAG